MRGPSDRGVAVRKPHGAIPPGSRPGDSPMARHRVFRLPVIRGVIALGESLGIGFRALAISANYAAQEEGSEVETELSRGQIFFAFAVAIAFALLLFKVGPALLVDQLVPVKSAAGFVRTAGAVRAPSLPSSLS